MLIPLNDPTAVLLKARLEAALAQAQTQLQIERAIYRPLAEILINDPNLTEADGHDLRQRHNWGHPQGIGA